MKYKFIQKPVSILFISLGLFSVKAMATPYVFRQYLEETHIPSCQPVPLKTETFTYTGSLQAVLIPPGSEYVVASVIGGGQGGGGVFEDSFYCEYYGECGDSPVTGASSSKLTGKFSLGGISTLDVYVGAGGTNNSTGPGNIGQQTALFENSSTELLGSSGICYGSTKYCSQSNAFNVTNVSTGVGAAGGYKSSGQNGSATISFYSCLFK